MLLRFCINGYLYSFERKVFPRMGKQDCAGRFERGCLKWLRLAAAQGHRNARKELKP